MNVNWALVVAPVEEPIALADAKLHLRVDDSVDDSLITRMVQGVRASAEPYLGRALMTQTWMYVQDWWSEEMRLPQAAPLQELLSVQYYDVSGTLQTLDPSFYLVDDIAEPAVIRRAPFKVWPPLQPARAGAVVITYLAGWETKDEIPPEILDGLYLLLTRRYMRRGDDAPQAAGPLDCPAAEACLAPRRVFWSPPCGGDRWR